MPQQTVNLCEVPKGLLKVAQDLVLGNHHEAAVVPQGTADILILPSVQRFNIRIIESEWERHPPLCHPDRSVAEWRDLQFYEPLMEMFSPPTKP